ncbi:hypothetical protein DVH24_007305 [Malus domestica]|uniref:Uncharacterized protein n=1 Tax=Malus domestica TaxID=3750 RepID=A0A498HGB8_MALDO|nr:hypothetical protein DVH24_007305 [Malus domestica]
MRNEEMKLMIFRKTKIEISLEFIDKNLPTEIGQELSALHFRCPSCALIFCVIMVKSRQHFILYNKTKMNSNIKC